MSSIFQVPVRSVGGGPVKFGNADGAIVGGHASQGLWINPDGTVAGSLNDPIAYRVGGIPFTAAGRVAVFVGAPTSIGPGATPYSATGRIAYGGDTTHHNHGVAYAATGALAAAVAAPPAEDQTVVTVALNETQYGFNGDEASGAVNPTVVFGLNILYLYGDSLSNRVVLGFVGGAQIAGVTSISMQFSGGGLPPGAFTIVWDGAFQWYDVIDGPAAGYLQSQNGANVTVDLVAL